MMGQEESILKSALFDCVAKVQVGMLLQVLPMIRLRQHPYCKKSQ